MSSPGIAVAEGSSASGDNKRFAGQIDNANARKAKRRREVEERAERERLRVETGAPIQPPYVWGMRVPITGDISNDVEAAAAQLSRTIIATGAIVCPPQQVSEIRVVVWVTDTMRLAGFLHCAITSIDGMRGLTFKTPGQVLKYLQAFQRDLGRNDDMELGAVVRGKTEAYHAKLQRYIDHIRATKTAGKTTKTAPTPAFPPLCAVHVSPTVAVTLEQATQDSTSTISTGAVNERAVALLRPLCEHIATHAVLWVPGLRVQSPGCIGKSGTKEHTYCKSLAQRARSRLVQSDQAHRPPPKFKFAELFAGIGGFRVALEQAGGECVFASEIDHEARCTYAMNFGDVASGDIAEIEPGAVPGFDVLTAGFPCQSHSRAGYQRGFDDYRGCLFFEVTRLLHSHSPAVFILENVPNLKEINNGAALALILDELGRAGAHGYDVAHMAINNNFRVPQQRERLYFVGFSKSPSGRTAASKFKWPADRETPCGTTVRDVLEANTTPEAVAMHTLSNHKWFKVKTAKKTGVNLRNRMCRLDGAARTLCSNYRRGYAQMSEFVPFRRPDGTFVDHVQAFDDELVLREAAGGVSVCEQEASRVSLVSATSSVAPDATTDDDVADGSVSGEDDCTEETADATTGPAEENPRFYTPRECARLMGFPEDFVIDEVCKSKNRIYHQMGNAVVPPVIAAIMDQVLQTGVFA